MDIREGIKSQFNDLGFEVTDNVLDKCVEICVLHNIDEETFVETWTAYSVTHLGGEAPTVDTLVLMERRELANQDKASSRQPTTPLTVYNKTPTSNKKAGAERWSQLDMTTPKGSKTAHFSTNPGCTFSPASFSPLSTTLSEKYSARSNAGEAVFEFLERAPGDWKGKDRVPLTIAPFTGKVLSSRRRLMLEGLSEKADVLDDLIDHIGSQVVEKNGLEEPLNVLKVVPAEGVFVGRVCCDADAHLNPYSVLLESSHSVSKGFAVPLDVSGLAHYSLFPGQVVAVQGVNPKGNLIYATKLYHPPALPLPGRLPRFTGTVEIVIAAGPLTQTDSLAYEPLEDLMLYVQSHKPHVLVLIGPLVDLRQPQLSDGSVADTYDAFFQKIVKNVVDQLRGSWTQVVIVASANEATCLPVFPTPPPLTPCSSPPLHMVSDPSLLSINGLVIALTATDSLMHLGKEETSFQMGGGDRLGRLASHLLQQQSVYPLYPPSLEVSADYGLWDHHATLPVTPHVLVTPSHFRYFIKPLHECLVVNPAQLAKGTAGGTFARLEVEPPSGNIWSPTTHISAQILKI